MKTPTSSPSPTRGSCGRGAVPQQKIKDRLVTQSESLSVRGAAAWVLAASPLLRMPPLPARRSMLTTAPGMLLRSLFTRATMVFRAPAHAFPAPLPWHHPTGFRAARASPARPRPRAQWVASAHPLHAYPRHRASNFRSHTSTNPTRVHGGCDVLQSRIASLFPQSPDVRLPPLTEASKRQARRAVAQPRVTARKVRVPSAPKRSTPTSWK